MGVHMCFRAAGGAGGVGAGWACLQASPPRSDPGCKPVCRSPGEHWLLRGSELSRRQRPTWNASASDPRATPPPALDPCCRSGLRFFQPWGLWLRSSGLLFATFLLLSLFSLVAGLLLASHLYLVASNTTTWEFISSHRIAYLRQRPGNPFDRGLTRNLAHFFCGWPSGSWEALWAEDEEEEGSSQAV